MNSNNKFLLFLIIGCLLISLKTPVFSNELKHYPPRIFYMPTTEVLGSLDIALIGGGTYRLEKERSLLGTIGLGLGNVAQLDFKTRQVLNNLKKGSATFPVAGFKLIVIKEKSTLPGITIEIELCNYSKVDDVFKKDNEQDLKIKYKTKFVDMFLVIGKNFDSLDLYSGLRINDNRIKDLYIDDIQNENVTEKDAYTTLGGMIGFKFEKNPNTFIMGEIVQLPHFKYDENQNKVKIASEYAFLGGVRFFFCNSLSLDVGVKYQTNYTGLVDTNIRSTINWVIPTLKQ